MAAPATSGDADRWAGTIVSSRQVAEAYGWEREDGEGIDRFR